jgi:hypothetical protein
MSYRPITDMWMLARAKLTGGKKYYGAYLGGFPERARRLLGISIDDSLLHLCSGRAKYYPYKMGFGQKDKTLDIDPLVEPDFLCDATKDIPLNDGKKWKAILIDPPYSEKDNENYNYEYPSPNKLLKNSFEVLEDGGKVGIIHYLIPKAPKNSIYVACVGVVCGFNNRIRVFSVFEKISEKR